MTAVAEAGQKRRGLIVLLIALMVLPTVAAVGYFVLAEGLPPWAQQGSYAAGKLVMVLPAVWLFGVERWRLRVPPPRRAEVLAGLGFGLAVAMLMLGIYFLWLKPAGLLGGAAIAIKAKIQGFGLNSLERFLAFAAIISLVHSFVEEYYWRGFVFQKLASFISNGLAAAISSLAFTGHHIVILGKYFGWGTPFQILFSAGVMIGGIVWCAMLHRWRTLYAPWLSHLLIDAAIFAVGYDLCWG